MTNTIEELEARVAACLLRDSSFMTLMLDLLTALKANDIQAREEIALIKQQHALALESAESEIETLQDALTKLVTLKYIKDEQGKTPYYIEQMPIAWAEAKNLVYGKGK